MPEVITLVPRRSFDLRVVDTALRLSPQFDGVATGNARRRQQLAGTFNAAVTSLVEYCEAAPFDALALFVVLTCYCLKLPRH